MPNRPIQMPLSPRAEKPKGHRILESQACHHNFDRPAATNRQLALCLGVFFRLLVSYSDVHVAE